MFTKEQELYFNEIIEVLNEINALDDVMIVGSWAEYIYEHDQMIDGFVSVAQTTDSDIYVRTDQNNTNSTSIIGPAERKGFLYEEDYMTGVSKLRKKEFEVEFLASQNGDGTKPLRKNKLGIKPQQLTHIWFIDNNYITADHNGYNIKIPCPEAYVIQKMIINSKRKEKAIIDREKIDNLLPFLNKSTFQRIYNQLYKKEKKSVDKYIAVYCPELWKVNTKQYEHAVINDYKKEQYNLTSSLSEQMESVWHNYFAMPKEQRTGIVWNHEKMRPAVFDDMYLAQCQKENKEPNEQIYKHFWENCVGRQDYTPKFCIKEIPHN